MSSKAVILLILTLILIAPASAYQIVKLIDGNTGDDISEGFVMLIAEETQIEYMLSVTEPLILPNSTNHTIHMFIRQPRHSTYAYATKIYAGKISTTIIMKPVGLVQGTLTDDVNNLIKDAEITSQCLTSTEYTTTDSAGYFRIFLPIEACRISATSHGKATQETIQIMQGEVTTLHMNLQSKVITANVPKKGLFYPGLAVVIILIFIFSFALFYHSKKKQKPVKKKYAAEKAKHALKEKEKMIIDELIAHNGKIALSQLRHNLQMPRTSLVRTIQGLESRNLVIKKEEHRKVIVKLLKNK